MFINFGNMFDDFIETFTIETKIGNQIQRQQMQIPPEIAQEQFLQLCKEVYQNPQPIKIKISKIRTIDCEYSNGTKDIEESIVYANQRYRDNFPEEFKDW